MTAEPTLEAGMRLAAQRLILAADSYGVRYLDSDDMTDEAQELQDATEAMKDVLAAAPVPPAGDDQWADLKAWAESLPPEYDVGKRKILEALAARAQPPVESLRLAAQDVIDRWDTPSWKDAEATAHVINRLRLVLKDHPAEPAVRDRVATARLKAAELAGIGRAREDATLIHIADTILSALRERAAGGEK